MNDYSCGATPVAAILNRNVYAGYPDETHIDRVFCQHCFEVEFPSWAKQAHLV